MANNLPNGFEDPADNEDIHEFAEMPYIEENSNRESFMDWLIKVGPEEAVKQLGL